MMYALVGILMFGEVLLCQIYDKEFDFSLMKLWPRDNKITFCESTFCSTCIHTPQLSLQLMVFVVVCVVVNFQIDLIMEGM